MKKKWLIAIGAFIFILVLIGNSGSETTSETNQAESGVSQTTLTTEEKQKIYYEVVQAEDKGQKEADEKYPTDAGSLSDSGLYKDESLMKKRIQDNIALADELQKKYKTEVLNKYGLNDEEFRSISIEANKNGWELPTY